MSWLNRILRAVGITGPSDRLGSPEPTIPCHEALAVVYEYLDGELDPAEAARVGAHLEVCARCYPQLRLERSFLATVARGGLDEVAPDDLKADVRRLLDDLDAG